MSVKIKEGPVKYKKRGLERSQIFWNGERGKSEVEKREVQNEKRVRVNGTIEKDGAKLGADYITRSNPENEERVEIKKKSLGNTRTETQSGAKYPGTEKEENLRWK